MGDTTEQSMRAEERIRAVRHVIDLGERLLDALGEAANELTTIQDELADEADLSTAQDRLASAKECTAKALVPLRQWLKRARRASEAHGPWDTRRSGQGD